MCKSDLCFPKGLRSNDKLTFSCNKIKQQIFPIIIEVIISIPRELRKKCYIILCVWGSINFQNSPWGFVKNIYSLLVKKFDISSKSILFLLLSNYACYVYLTKCGVLKSLTSIFLLMLSTLTRVFALYIVKTFHLMDKVSCNYIFIEFEKYYQTEMNCFPLMHFTYILCFLMVVLSLCFLFWLKLAQYTLIHYICVCVLYIYKMYIYSVKKKVITAMEIRKSRTACRRCRRGRQEVRELSFSIK